MPTITVDYNPQPRQCAFHACAADEVLYGGAAGGGKSHALLFDALANAMDFPKCHIIMFRRTFPELERSLIQKSKDLYPQKLGTYNNSLKRWTFLNGSTIEFSYLDKEDDVTNYQSAEYDFIYFDELTHFTRRQYVYMLSRLRGSNPNIHRQMKSASNPGGTWVKKRFIDVGEPEMVHHVQETDDDGNPLFLNGEPVIRSRCFIPANIYDNPALLNADPQYLMNLMSLSDKDRKQLLEGSWDVFDGQMFSEWRRGLHVIKPFPIPEHWTRIRAIDEGYNDPFVCQWWAFDEQGKAYLYRELNQTKLLASEQAERVKELTPSTEQIRYTVADTSMWAKSKDSGVSPAEIFMKAGIPLLQATKERKNGWMRVREYMHVYEERDIVTGNLIPTTDMYVFDTCQNFINSVPELLIDENDPEDIADGQNDHDADTCRYALMSRPPKTQKPKEPLPADPEQRWLNKMNEQHFKRVQSRQRRSSW